MAGHKIRSIPAQDPIVEPINQNVSYHYEYDVDDNLVLIEKTVGNEVFARTFTWDVNGNLTDISEWVRA